MFLSFLPDKRVVGNILELFLIEMVKQEVFRGVIRWWKSIVMVGVGILLFCRKQRKVKRALNLA